MTDLGMHIRIRLTEDRVIATTDSERRAVAGAVLRIAERVPVLGFGLVDTHFHGQSLGDEAQANEITRRIGGSLRRVLALPIGFKTLPPKPIKDIWHLGRCFRYVHTQASGHGVAWDRWYEATTLPDLLGLRPRGAFMADRVRRHLPRLRERDLLEWLGVSRIDPGKGSPEEVLDAALGASALPGLRGHSRETNTVRCAVLALVRGTISVDAEATLLKTSRRTITRLRAMAPEPALVRAISLNLGLRELLRSRAAGAASGQALERRDSLA